MFFKKSHGNHTAGEVRWVRLHLHRSEVSDPDTMLRHRCHNTRRKQVSGIETDRYCFFREYCKELKLSLNNTEFLLDFSQYIDRNTPNACESRFFSSLFLICTGSDVSLPHCFALMWVMKCSSDPHNVAWINIQCFCIALLTVMRVEVCAFVYLHGTVCLTVSSHGGTSHSRRSASERSQLDFGQQDLSRVMSAWSTEFPRNTMPSCYTMTHDAWFVII